MSHELLKNNYEKIMEVVSSADFKIEETEELQSITNEIRQIEEKFGVHDENFSLFLDNKFEKINSIKRTIDKLKEIESLRERISSILNQIHQNELEDFESFLSEEIQAVFFLPKKEKIEKNAVVSLEEGKVIFNDTTIENIDCIFKNQKSFDQIYNRLIEMLEDAEKDLNKVKQIFDKVQFKQESSVIYAIKKKINEIERKIEIMDTFLSLSNKKNDLKEKLKTLSSLDKKNIAFLLGENDANKENHSTDFVVKNEDNLIQNQIVENDNKLLIVPNSFSLFDDLVGSEKKVNLNFERLGDDYLGTIKQIREEGKEVSSQVLFEIEELQKATPLIDFEELTPSEINEIHQILVDIKELSESEIQDKILDIGIHGIVAASVITKNKGLIKLPSAFLSSVQRLELKNNATQQKTLNKIALGVLISHEKLLKNNVNLNFETNDLQSIKSLFKKGEYLSDEYSDFIQKYKITPAYVFFLLKTQDFFEKRINLFRENLDKYLEILEFHSHLAVKIKLENKKFSDFIGSEMAYNLLGENDPSRLRQDEWQKNNIVSVLKSIVNSFISNGVISLPQLNLVKRSFNDYFSIVQNSIETNPEFAEIVMKPTKRPLKDANMAQFEINQLLNDYNHNKINFEVASGKGKHHLLSLKFNNLILDLCYDRKKAEDLIGIHPCPAYLLIKEIGIDAFSNYFTMSVEQRNKIKGKYKTNFKKHYQMFFKVLDSYL